MLVVVQWLELLRVRTCGRRQTAMSELWRAEVIHPECNQPTISTSA
jgi:hypothetical protein